MPELAKRWRVDRVFAQRWAEPFARLRDSVIRDSPDVPFEPFEGETLLPPGSVLNGAAEPYSVFTPFSRRCFQLLADAEPQPSAAPRRLPAPLTTTNSATGWTWPAPAACLKT